MKSILLLTVFIISALNKLSAQSFSISELENIHNKGYIWMLTNKPKGFRLGLAIDEKSDIVDFSSADYDYQKKSYKEFIQMSKTNQELRYTMLYESSFRSFISSLSKYGYKFMGYESVNGKSYPYYQKGKRLVVDLSSQGTRDEPYYTITFSILD